MSTLKDYANALGVTVASLKNLFPPGSSIQGKSPTAKLNPAEEKLILNLASQPQPQPQRQPQPRQPSPQRTNQPREAPKPSEKTGEQPKNKSWLQQQVDGFNQVVKGDKS